MILKCTQDCVLTNKATRYAKPAEGANPAVAAVNVPSDLEFNIKDCKLYVPVVTLPKEFENKLYEELKSGLTTTLKRDKYRSQSINQSATNNLNYLIDPTFNNSIDYLLWPLKMSRTENLTLNTTCLPLK